LARTFVLGDIHGAYRALRQCFERSGFDSKQDHLIFLGDVSDGWPETRLCVDELLKVTHLTPLLGNHDQWTLQWMKSGIGEDIWLMQGGKATVKSYADGIPQQHQQFLESCLPYYILENKLFVHAGIDPKVPIENQTIEIFLWDRTLARTALYFHERGIETRLTTYDEVYVGHTPIAQLKPLKACEVWLMDTGAGWSGVLSMLNLESKEIFSSDEVPTLYPGIEGRQRLR